MLIGLPFIARFAVVRLNETSKISSATRRYQPVSEMNYDSDAKEFSVNQPQFQLDTGSLITEAERDTTADEPTDR